MTIDEQERWVLAALTAHAVNSLTIEWQCCPHSCAPCGALQILHENEAMEATLQPYLSIDPFADWDWWDRRTCTFRWNWVTDRWCDPDTCEDKK